MALAKVAYRNVNKDFRISLKSLPSLLDYKRLNSKQGSLVMIIIFGILLILQFVCCSHIHAMALVKSKDSFDLGVQLSHQEIKNITFTNFDDNRISYTGEVIQTICSLNLRYGIADEAEVGVSSNYVMTNATNHLVKDNEGLSDFSVHWKKMFDFSPAYLSYTVKYTGPASENAPSQELANGSQSPSYQMDLNATYLNLKTPRMASNLLYTYKLHTGEYNPNQHHINLSHYFIGSNISFGGGLGHVQNENEYNTDSKNFLELYLSEKPIGALEEEYNYFAGSIIYSFRPHTINFSFLRKFSSNSKSFADGQMLSLGYSISGYGHHEK